MAASLAQTPPDATSFILSSFQSRGHLAALVSPSTESCHILCSEILSEQLLLVSVSLVKHLCDTKAVIADMGEGCREAG